ncbi:MAG: MATE family efflux transporter [Clostridia bacterium]|nr:MATE family efflux transporter [Clostridia bacterium]
MKKRSFLRLPWYLIPTIFALAWPTMLEQLMQTAVQYIDVAMVGSLGTEATAAVGSTTTVNWLIGSTVSALGVGFLAFVSRAMGAGEKETVKRISSQAVLAVLVCGVLFTSLTLGLSPFIPAWMQVDAGLRPLASRYFFVLYTPMLFRCATIIFGTLFRAVGDTKTPMLVGIAVNLINVVMNFFLIYPTRQADIFSLNLTIPGAGLGVVGAAIASALSFAVGGLILAIAFWRHSILSPKGYSIRPDREILGRCLKVAAPNALQGFGTSLGYVAFAAMVNSLGGVSTAAHTIANTVESAFYIPGYGMKTAAATLAGNAYGARDAKRLRELSRMILWIEVFLMVLSGGLLFLFAPSMMKLFSTDEQTIRLGATVLRMVALSEPFYGVSIIIEGIFQGLGRTGMPFVTNVIGMWGIRIVGTFICIHGCSMGLVSAWACMILHNLMLFAVFSIYFARGKWNPMRNEPRWN